MTKKTISRLFILSSIGLGLPLIYISSKTPVYALQINPDQKTESMEPASIQDSESRIHAEVTTEPQEETAEGADRQDQEKENHTEAISKSDTSDSDKNSDKREENKSSEKEVNSIENSH